MGTTPLPKAEKKRAEDSRGKHPIRDALLKPKTWKSMLLIFRAIYGMIRIGAKILEMFT